MYCIAGKFDGKLNLAVWGSGLKQANSFSPATRNAHSSSLKPTWRPSTQAVHIACVAPVRCQLYVSYICKVMALFMYFKREDSNTLPDICAQNVWDDVICCEAPLTNLNFANIFYAQFGANPPNLQTVNISSYTNSHLTLPAYFTILPFYYLSLHICMHTSSHIHTPT